MKNQEMSRFVPDHVKTKKICLSMPLKNYLIYEDMFLINIRLNKCYSYVIDEANLENGGTLKSVPDC